MVENELIIAGLCGILGALSKDIFIDNAIELPKKNGEKLVLGSLGGLIIGAIVGVLLDGSPLNAFMAGFTGIAIIQSLIENKHSTFQVLEPENDTKEEITREKLIELIKQTAKKYGINQNLAVKVAECESNLNPQAININAPDSIDRGLYQINSKWHPHITDEQAFDPQFSTNFFCEAVKAGNLKWWDASKKCWETENT